MASERPPSTNTPQAIAAAVSEIAERSSLLIREEIELAKAEVTEKVTTLLKGAAVGLAAGVFAIFGLIYLLHGIAWLLNGFIGTAFWGFFVVAAVLFLAGAGAGFLAAKWLRVGAPKPEMAIDEAQRIRQTLSGDSGGQLEAVAARAQAGQSAEEVARATASEGSS